MDNECAFERLHPFTLLLWFAVTLSVTVLSSDPVFAVLSFLFAAAFRISDASRPVTFRAALGLLLFMAMMTLLNPLFSHHGATVLFFFRDLPVTREALFFGLFMSFTVAASLLWCGALSRCMKSDKVIFLFGRALPRLAVLISLTLRFVPLYKERYKSIADAQRAAGLYDDSTLPRHIKTSLGIFGALMTMILEDSIETADSMRARGITLRGRTFYSDYRMHAYDVPILAVTLCTAAYFAAARALGFTAYSFYPIMTALPVSAQAVTAYAAFGLLTALPVLTEVIFWRLSGSKT